MDYLVVAPNTPFYQWQIALLVQSFKLHGKEENLVIMMIVGNEPPIMSMFAKSFIDHPRLHMVRIPDTLEPEIMRLRGLAYAVQSGLVSRPFTLVPPHCVMRHPIEDVKADITFSCKPDFSLHHLDGFGISSKAIIERLGGKRQWLPVSDVIVFNNPVMQFFATAINRGELIAFDSYREILKSGQDFAPKSILRAAMSMTIMEFYKHLKIDTSKNLECHMNEQHKTPNFINYYYGSPPNFSRHYYPMTPNVFKFADDPFQGILHSDETYPSMYMKHVVKTLVASQSSVVT